MRSWPADGGSVCWGRRGRVRLGRGPRGGGLRLDELQPWRELAQGLELQSQRDGRDEGQLGQPLHPVLPEPLMALFEGGGEMAPQLRRAPGGEQLVPHPILEEALVRAEVVEVLDCR